MSFQQASREIHPGSSPPGAMMPPPGPTFDSKRTISEVTDHDASHTLQKREVNRADREQLSNKVPRLAHPSDESQASQSIQHPPVDPAPASSSQHHQPNPAAGASTAPSANSLAALAPSAASQALPDEGNVDALLDLIDDDF